MKTYKQWQGRELYNELKLPSVEDGPIGNELKDVQSGGQVIPSPFQQKTEQFKKKLTELPTPSTDEKKGLGNLGMNMVGKSTFKAGETPTISNGVPVENVNEVALGSTDLKQQAAGQIDQFLGSDDAPLLAKRIIGLLRRRPRNQIIQIFQQLQQEIPLLLQQQSPAIARQAL